MPQTCKAAVIDPQSFDELRAQSQRCVIDFLLVEIQLGFTFIETYTFERDQGDLQHSDHVKGEAWKAAATVHQFLDRIESDKVRSAILDRCVELERAFAALPARKI